MPGHKKAPSASKTKRLIHAFYMVQPILQFLALAFVIGALTRCSPLSPSANKSSLDESEILVQSQQERAQTIAEAELINSTAKELSNNEIKVVKETYFERNAEKGLRTDEKSNETEVNNIWKERNQNTQTNRRPKILSILLTEEQRTKLWDEGRVQIDLNDYARRNLDEKAKKTFFRSLKRNNDELNIDAQAFIVVPDASFQNEYSELSEKIKISLSAPNEEKAVVLISREVNESEEDAALLNSALTDAKLTAIILE